MSLYRRLSSSALHTVPYTRTTVALCALMTLMPELAMAQAAPLPVSESVMGSSAGARVSPNMQVRRVATPPMNAAALGAVPVLPLEVGKGAMLTLPSAASSIFIVDPTIADVQSPSPRNVFVLAKKWGSTTLYVMGADAKPILQRTVTVAPNLDTMRDMLHTRFPTMNLQLDTAENSLLISGSAPTASDADAVVEALKPMVSDKTSLVNRMTVAQPQQIQLQVRITEVDRNVTQQLGINWQSLGSATGNFIGGVFSGRSIYDLTTPLTNAAGKTYYPVASSGTNAFSFLTGFKTGNTDIEAMIDALNQEGLITVLAEPNLVALNGQTASFLAGGEFPIPVSETNGSVAVQFKQFGVKLDFTPTILNDGRISLKVRPEVSQVDTSVSVTTASITVPGISVRRADTTVELSSGQSFAIAGLLQNMTSDTVSQVPGLGAIPILGKLFTSKKYTNNKTELVITVTPYLVKPTNPGKLRDTLQSLTGIQNDAEYSMGLSSGASTDPSAPHLTGSAGYIY